MKTPTTASVVDPRSVAAIALRPVGNTQGGYFFMRLDNWRVVTRYQWHQFNMPEDIVKQIEARADFEAQTKSSKQNEDREHLVFRQANDKIWNDTVTELPVPASTEESKDDQHDDTQQSLADVYDTMSEHEDADESLDDNSSEDQERDLDENQERVDNQE